MKARHSALCFNLAIIYIIGVTPALAAKAGETCMGIGAIKCDEGLYCETPVGTCKTPDGAGKCEAKPDDSGRDLFGPCSLEFIPVCGCDGKTYGNDCVRKSAGAQLDFVGECRA